MKALLADLRTHNPSSSGDQLTDNIDGSDKSMKEKLNIDEIIVKAFKKHLKS